MKIYDQRGINYYTPQHIIVPYILENAPISKSIIDFGCGDGRILAQVVNQLKPKEVYGVDISGVRIEYAKIKLPSVEFIKDDIKHFLTVCDREYELGLIFEVLEHLEDDISTLMLAKKTCNLILGSVPILIPDDTHIRVFKDVDEIIHRYNLKSWRRVNQHLLFKIYN